MAGKLPCWNTPLGHAVPLPVSTAVQSIADKVMWAYSAFILPSVGLSRCGNVFGVQSDTPDGHLAAAACPHDHQPDEDIA